MAQGSIKKRGSNYHIIYTVNGKQKWKSIGPRKRDAEKALAEIQNQINRGTYQELKKITFGDFANEWYELYALPKFRSYSLKNTRSFIDRHFIPFFGADTPLTSISAIEIQKYVSVKLQEGLSPSSITRHLVPLKTMFKYAVVWDYVRKNPAEHIKNPVAYKEEMKFLAPNQINRLLSAIDYKYRPIFTTATLTGLRQGELFALKWEDIDWNNKTINVKRSLAGDTKTTKSKRRVVMSPKLIAELSAHREFNIDSEYVFATNNGNPHNPRNIVQRVFEPALKEAGLPRIRFHDLRHTYAALMISLGINVKFLQDQLGHTSIRTTLDTYGHLIPDSDNGVGEKIDELVFGNFVSKILAKGTLEITRNKEAAGKLGAHGQD